METTGQGLYPAEHRALREAHASARRLSGHWEALARRLGGDAAAPLREGAGACSSFLDELTSRTEAHGLFGTPAAQGVGSLAAGLRNGAGDLLLERNQAMRGAVLELQQLTTLLGYLGRLAEARGDAQLAGFHTEWETRLRAIEEQARQAALAMGTDPSDAVAPADPGPLGRVGHQVAAALGSAGEAIDNSAVGRAARRRSGS